MSIFTKQEQRFILLLLFSFSLGLGVKYVREKRYEPDQAWVKEKEEILAEFKERARTTGGDSEAAVQEDVQPAAAKVKLIKKVNINSASEREFETLPKIGPVIAKRIVEDRRQNGPFRSVEELQRVKGIGSKTFAMIKEYITVQ
jgi:competence protein ComEA